MTPEQYERQSRDAVIAYLQDSSVSLEALFKRGVLPKDWIKKSNSEVFDLGSFYYRIAQPKPWYRVSLMNYGVEVVISEHGEEKHNNSSDFIKWLTDRIEYENS